MILVIASPQNGNTSSRGIREYRCREYTITPTILDSVTKHACWAELLLDNALW